MSKYADRLEQMRGAVSRVQDKPVEVAAQARQCLDTLDSGSEGTEIEATAAWAAGLAAREQNDLDAADEFLERAIRVACAIGADSLEGRIRLSRALVHTYIGNDRDAMSELTRAEALLSGGERGYVLLQRALIEQRAGDLEQALSVYAAALPLVQAAGDILAEARLRANRGVAMGYVGDFDAAEEELTEARRLATQLGQSLLVAGCGHNLGFLYGRRGDIPRALHWLDKARQEAKALDADARMGAIILADRAELLAAVGLVGEALADARESRDTVADTQNELDLSEVNLQLARVALAAGDTDQASEAAREAASGFEAQGRDPWAVLARSIEFHSRREVVSLVHSAVADDAAVGDPVQLARMATEAFDQADSLDVAGWRSDALLMRLTSARAWLAYGDERRGCRELGTVALARNVGPAAERVMGWQAEAMLRLASGDRQGARRAIHAGLRVVQDYRLTLAAADLRATVSASADELASWLVELAIQSGRGRDVLAAAEVWRADSLVAPVSPPADPELEQLLGRLRVIDAEERRDGAARATERARLEVAVRDRARHLPARRSEARSRFRVPELVDRVRDEVLVEFVDRRGSLLVVFVADGAVRVRAAGRTVEAISEARSARACLQRLARATGSTRSLEAAAATLTEATRRLGDQLFGQVSKLEGRSVVVIPTGALHSVPWSAIPGLAEVSFVVSPSSRAWMAAKNVSLDAAPGVVLLTAGPDLDGAREEVERLAELYGDAICLTGACASVQSSLRHLREAAVAHFAAHGTFRTDNPLLSSLRLADGSLTVYDIERLPSIPRTMILSACDAAAVRVHAGDELLGFSSTMLGLGSSTVVAPMLPVPDDVTAELLVDLHRGLVAGMTASEALRRARVSLLDIGGSATDVFRRQAAAGSFVAIGA